MCKEFQPLPCSEVLEPKRIKAPSGPSSVREQAMRNEPLKDMWRQNFWAHSRYVKRVLVDMDSWTVAMYVGTLSGVCNNSPTESTGPENG